MRCFHRSWVSFCALLATLCLSYPTLADDSFFGDAPIGGGGGDSFGGGEGGFGGGMNDDPFGPPPSQKGKKGGAAFGDDSFAGPAGGGKGGDPFGGGDSFGGGEGGFGGGVNDDPFSSPTSRRKGGGHSIGAEDPFGSGGLSQNMQGPNSRFSKKTNGLGQNQALSAQLPPEVVTDLKHKMNLTDVTLPWDKQGLSGKLTCVEQPGHLVNPSDDDRDQQRTNDNKLFFEIAQVGKQPGQELADLQNGLMVLRAEGVDVIFSLAHPRTDRNPQLIQFLWDRMGDRGPCITEMDGISLATRAGKLPTLKQLDVLSSSIEQHMRSGRHVVIMSGEGRERVGMVIAAVYMRAFKQHKAEFVKETINGELSESIHTQEQMTLLKNFAKFLQKKSSPNDDSDTDTNDDDDNKEKPTKKEDTLTDDEIDAAANGGSD